MNYTITKIAADQGFNGIDMDKKKECISSIIEIKNIQKKLEKLGFSESSELLKLAVISLYMSNDMLSEDDLL